MVTSRTGTRKYLAARAEVIAEAQANGLTYCPGFDDHECGQPLDYLNALRPNSAETDHVLRHADGGSDEAANLRVLCRSCNLARNRPPTETGYQSGDFPTTRAW